MMTRVRGQLGDSTTADRPLPVSVATLMRLSAIVGGRSVSACRWRASHTCAIGLESALFCWGAKDFGQLSTGDVADRQVPFPALPPAP